MSEGKKFRVLDTGVMEGRLNIAIGQAIIEAHQAGQAPDTLRFLRFPPTALVGRHQALGQEIDLEYCRQNDIGVVRRITGGGAIFMEPGLLGWELAFNRKTLGVNSLPDLTREICEAAADGISRLGVEARYRPRNDIEVDGRKISGTGGFFDGDVLIYQGTVLVDMNSQQMVSALNIPESKLAKRELDSAAQRVVTLKELLGDELPGIEAIKAALVKGFTEGLGIAAEPGEITENEEALANRHFIEEIGTDEFVAEIDNPGDDNETLAGSHTGPGGTIDTFVKLEGPTRRILQRALITGDFFVTPPRIVFDLEAHLAGTRLDEIDAEIDRFFADNDIDMLSVAPDDFKSAIYNAVGEESGNG